jgi:hypothetical protein
MIVEDQKCNLGLLARRPSGPFLIAGPECIICSFAASSRGKRLLDELTQEAGPGLIVLLGHTDAAEVQPQDRNLGARRAEAVRQYLVDAGKDGQWIFAVDRGASEPLVPTKPRVAEPHNRRVVMMFSRHWTASQRREQMQCIDWIKLQYLGDEPRHPKCGAAVDGLLRY